MPVVVTTVATAEYRTTNIGNGLHYARFLVIGDVRSVSIKSTDIFNSERHTSILRDSENWQVRGTLPTYAVRVETKVVPLHVVH